MHIAGAQLDCARPDPLRARASLRQGYGTAGKARPYNRTPAGPGVFFCAPSGRRKPARLVTYYVTSGLRPPATRGALLSIE
jgi:hypothetical protein